MSMYAHQLADEVYRLQRQHHHLEATLQQLDGILERTTCLDAYDRRLAEHTVTKQQLLEVEAELERLGVPRWAEVGDPNLPF